MAKASKPKTAPGGAPGTATVGTKSSKTHAASKGANDDVALLLQLATQAPVLTFPQRKSEAKLYELVVLAEMFEEFNSTPGNSVFLHQPTAGIPNSLAGAPASADKSKYAWFELSSANPDHNAEAWVSVQFTGLSATLATRYLGFPPADLQASRHELDITLLRPEPAAAAPRLYPEYSDILAAVSVKHVARLHKESVREALGFRREMAMLVGPGHGSECDWLEPDVPCNPRSPLFLASSAPNFEGYAGQIDQFGIFPRYMKYPW